MKTMAMPNGAAAVRAAAPSSRMNSKMASLTRTTALPTMTRRTRRATKGRSSAIVAVAGAGKKVLIMGGTRFIGPYVTRMLVDEGHDVTLFTRGKSEITPRIPDDVDDAKYEEFKSSVSHIAGDRKNADDVKSKLSGQGFEIVFDINGREATEAEMLLDAVGDTLEQYIYCSSAGVYLKSDEMPHYEKDPGDPKSRHKGKLDTEDLLMNKGVNFTSLRPVYIYGPLNYNPVEEWFFHRLAAGRPIPIPDSGMQVTQLGHVKDLAEAFVKCIGNEKAARQIYNISGERFVSFDGIARACAEAGGFEMPELIHYNPKDMDFGGKKAFPLRSQHFYTNIEKAMRDLDWEPKFGLIDGLRDSYSKDFGRGTYRKEADFTTDDIILESVKKTELVQ